jgi:KUP system potassium uptake protein
MLKDKDRIQLKEMGGGVYLVRAMYGFKETPDINQIMNLSASQHEIICELLWKPHTF